MPTDTPEARAARLDAYEARYAPKLAAALIRDCARAVSAAEQGATPAIAASFVTDTHVAEVLTQVYRTVAVGEAERTYDALTEGQKAAPPATVKEGWLSRARRFIRGEGAAALRALTERTREIVQDVLTEAQQLGLSVPDAAKRLRQQVAGISRERARQIVRTEVNASSNYGSLWGAQATGLKLLQEWLATPGGRTRPSHAAADGQRVALGGLFTVGVGQGRFPGDVLLPVGERANCRCSIGYVPIE